MSVLDLIVISAATVTVGFYVLRLDALKVRQHKLNFIALHVLLMGCASSAGINAWESDIHLSDVMGLLSAITWLFISQPSWKNGPPEHTKTHPGSLEPMGFPKGKK